MHDYRGIIHVHSSYSDGLADVDRIMYEANEAKVDFVILTDHNTMKAKVEGYEGWHGRCLLLVGEEITPNTNADHYLALDIQKAIPPSNDPKVNVAEVKKQNGIGVVAHPTKGADANAQYGEYPWTDWDAGPYDGIEIWNHTYDVTVRAKNLLQLITFFLFPVLATLGPMEGVLATWDRYAAYDRRRLVAIGGADAHGILVMYRDSFRTVSTHILTPEPFNGSLRHDSALVYDAIRACRCYVVADKVDDCSGFGCQISSGHVELEMGSSANLTADTVMRVNVPKVGLITIIRDGAPIAETYGKSFEVRLEQAGAYRVEVRRKVCRRYVPWIYGNHFFLA